MKLARLAAVLAIFVPTALARSEDKPVVLEGGDGPGKGKHVVLISGDQEYRSALLNSALTSDQFRPPFLIGRVYPR